MHIYIYINKSFYLYIYISIFYYIYLSIYLSRWEDHGNIIEPTGGFSVQTPLSRLSRAQHHTLSSGAGGAPAPSNSCKACRGDRLTQPKRWFYRTQNEDFSNLTNRQIEMIGNVWIIVGNHVDILKLREGKCSSLASPWPVETNDGRRTAGKHISLDQASISVSRHTGWPEVSHVEMWVFSWLGFVYVPTYCKQKAQRAKEHITFFWAV